MKSFLLSPLRSSLNPISFVQAKFLLGSSEIIIILFNNIPCKALGIFFCFVVINPGNSCCNQKRMNKHVFNTTGRNSLTSFYQPAYILFNSSIDQYLVFHTALHSLCCQLMFHFSAECPSFTSSFSFHLKHSCFPYLKQPSISNLGS